MEIDKYIQTLLHGLQYKKLLESKMEFIREKYGLREVEVKVLYFLTHCGDHNTARDIREEMKLTKGHISQAVDRLQKMGFLVLIPDQGDRRYVHLQLTKQAKSVTEEIQREWSGLNQIVFAGITKEEEETLKRVALKIANNLEKELK